MQSLQAKTSLIYSRHRKNFHVVVGSEMQVPEYVGLESFVKFYSHCSVLSGGPARSDLCFGKIHAAFLGNVL